MTKAFVLIKVKSGTEKALLDALFTVPEVQEAHTITGDYDLIAVMSTNEDDLARYHDEKIVEALTEKIRKMENVLDTNFEYANYSIGDYLVFSLRLDQKRIPPPLMKIKLLEAEIKPQEIIILNPAFSES